MAGKPINVEVVVRRNEPIERAIRRFNKRVKKEGIIDNLIKNKYYEKPAAKRHKKKMRIKRLNEQKKLNNSREGKNVN
jgi:small subunit ribosomal protein S21